MNQMEEQLWNYIDGTCGAQEQQAVSDLIANDAAWKKKYQELLQFNAEIQQMELDEPPMAFTYNIMETIRPEQARQPLKAAINSKLIAVIGGLFILSIVLMLVNTLSGLHLSFKMPELPSINTTKVPLLKNYITAPVIKAFLFFDVLAGLALLDGYLRKRNFSKQV